MHSWVSELTLGVSEVINGFICPIQIYSWEEKFSVCAQNSWHYFALFPCKVANLPEFKHNS